MTTYSNPKREAKVGLFLIGAALLIGAAAPRSQPEHKVWRVTSVTTNNPGKMDEQANELGGQGWEMVSCIQTSVTYQMRCWFKQEITGDNFAGLPPSGR